MLPIFSSKIRSYNNNEIYVDDSYIVCNYGANFPQSLGHFQHTSANVQ
jgi:hypothetical protein